MVKTRSLLRSISPRSLQRPIERSAGVYDEIMQLSLDRYNARPHWGKNENPSFHQIGAAQYPRWGDFIELKSSMDPSGLFDNKLWDQMSGDAPIQRYPGCALSRDCICAVDSDCGTGYRCDQGSYYEGARVCRPN